MKTKRNYKDSMFRMLHLDKKELLSLYNAVNETHYTNIEELEVNTLKNAVYMNMKNDVSFLFDFQLNLYEHQSTVNPNIPLRDLLYVSKLLQSIVRDDDLYGTTLVKIPTPRFVVFYNGKEKQPQRRVYKLSDAFVKKLSEPELELTVTVLNINSGNNTKLLDNCKTLKEYMQYIEKVREHVLHMSIEQAVERAVTECIKEGILAEFLRKNRAEAIEVSIFEYNEEQHLANVRREGYEEGAHIVLVEAIIAILKQHGEVSSNVEDIIKDQTEINVLKKWLLLATSVDEVESFWKKVRE